MGVETYPRADMTEETVAFVAVRAAKDAVLETSETMFASGVRNELVALRTPTFAPPTTLSFPLLKRPEFTVRE